MKIHNTELVSRLGKVVTVKLSAKEGVIEQAGEEPLAVNILGVTPAFSGRIIAIHQGELVVGEKNRIIYGPEVKEMLGLPQNAPVDCYYEKSCGAILYTQKNGETLFLLIKTASNHIGFPKGHIEHGETEEETALREIKEETGIEARLDKGTRWHYEYFTKNNTRKRCVYFLGSYSNQPPVFDPEEIFEHWLVPYNEAMLLLNFVQDKELLSEAYRRIPRGY